MEEPNGSHDGVVSSKSSGLGDRLTVLSIDGGGIRGIIPGTILNFLESKLQVNINKYISACFLKKKLYLFSFYLVW